MLVEESIGGHLELGQDVQDQCKHRCRRLCSTPVHVESSAHVRQRVSPAGRSATVQPRLTTHCELRNAFITQVSTWGPRMRKSESNRRCGKWCEKLSHSATCSGQIGGKGGWHTHNGACAVMFDKPDGTNNASHPVASSALRSVIVLCLLSTHRGQDSQLRHQGDSPAPCHVILLGARGWFVSACDRACTAGMCPWANICFVPTFIKETEGTGMRLNSKGK
jgi:hypothetical protein